MYLVTGKSVSSNPMENVSEEVKKFVLLHHRGYGKEEMMKKLPDEDDSKEEYKFETPKFHVEEVVQESPKEARETQEESEKTSDESGSISEAPSESTIPFSNDSYTTMDNDDLVANLCLEEVEPLEAALTPSETPNPEKPLSHVSVPLETMTSEGDERELRLLHARPSKNSFPSSKEDLEETLLLLLNEIDRLQKPKLKEKWNSMVYLDEYDAEDGTYFNVGEESVMLHELHEALEQEEQEIEGEEEKKEERKDELRRKDIKRLSKKAKEKKKIDHQVNQMILDPEQVLALKKLTEQDEKSEKQELGASNLHASEDLKISLDKMDVDERIKKIILHSSDVFGPLPPPGSVKKVVTMDLELREEFLKDLVPCRPWPASKDDMAEITRQITECVQAGLVYEYKETGYPKHCSPCFLVAKPGSTVKKLVVNYKKVNQKKKLHSGSLPLMENTVETAAGCRYETEMDKRSGFWQIDLTEPAQDLTAFIAPDGRVYKWRVM